MMVRTNRSFNDVEDKEVFVLHTKNNSEYSLISDGSDKYAKGTTVNGWYLCANCGISIKINNIKIVKLKQGEFYNLKENEIITHKKNIGSIKFTKEKLWRKNSI